MSQVCLTCRESLDKNAVHAINRGCNNWRSILELEQMGANGVAFDKTKNGGKTVQWFAYRGSKMIRSMQTDKPDWENALGLENRWVEENTAILHDCGKITWSASCQKICHGKHKYPHQALIIPLIIGRFQLSLLESSRNNFSCGVSMAKQWNKPLITTELSTCKHIRATSNCNCITHITHVHCNRELNIPLYWNMNQIISCSTTFTIF